MLKTNISSSLTPIYKFGFPVIWVGGFSIGTALMYYRHVPQASLFFLITVIGAVLLIPLGVKLKYVEIDDNIVYLKGVMQQVTIPISEVVSVRQVLAINIKPAIIVFRSKTIFGRYVLFIPRRSAGQLHRDKVIDLFRERIKMNNPNSMDDG